MPTEQVIIEFISDTSQLQPAEDKLTNLGKIDAKSAVIFKATNDELRNRNLLTGQLAVNITKEQEVVNKLVASLKNLSGESRRSVENLLKLSTGEIAAGFRKTNISVDDYIAVLKKAGTQTTKTETATVSLRQQLRNLTQQLAQLKLEGKDNTAMFTTMAREAGRIKDAMRDAGSEIQNFASDTRTIDQVIGSVQALAGGFALVQGAAGLFGDQSEELQETLLKVNSAMAIAHGIQQVSNALEKEGALTKLASTIATKSQIAAQTAYNFVIGSSTGLLKAFRIALASTGIGLILIAIAALVANFDRIKSAISGISDAQKDLLESSKKTVEEEEKKLQALEDQDNVLKLQGKNEKEILALKVKQIDAVIEARKQNLLVQEGILKSQIIAEKRNKDILTGLINFVSIPINALLKSIEFIAKAFGKEIDLPTFGETVAQMAFNEKKIKEAGDKANIELQNQLKEMENQRAGFLLRQREIDKKDAQEQADLRRREREKKLADELAELERQLLRAEQTGAVIIGIQKKIIDKKAQIELEAEGLTANKVALIKEGAEQKKLDLIIESNKKISAQAMADQISRNNKELAQLNISEREKLDLIIDNLILHGQAEADATNGNNAKIIEINASRDQKIREARLASIERTLENELALEKSLNGAIVREMQNRIQDESQPLQVRLDAINLITGLELHAVRTRIGAVNNEFRAKLISQEDYSLKLAELKDKEAEIFKDGEDKKREEVDKTTKKLSDADKERISQAIEIASQVSNLIGTFFQAQNDRENQAFDRQRRNIDELRISGAITEKEALNRLKRLDNEERKIRRQQAERDKAIAIFNAIINTAAAVAKYAGNIPLQVFAAAVGAAQIAVIASRPIPKFGKGKKGNYEGLGEIGETGAELLESKGRMYVAKKKTIVWLGKSDKVYNPKETQRIIERSLPTVNNVVISGGKSGQAAFDYERLGKEIGKHTSMSLSIDGYKDFIKEQQSFTTYLNNRRAY